MSDEPTGDRPPAGSAPGSPGGSGTSGGAAGRRPAASLPGGAAGRSGSRNARGQAAIKRQLEEAVAAIAMMVMAAGDQHCATILAAQAEPLAEAWSNLAAQNRQVKRILEGLLSGSAWGQVIFVTAATAIPIAQHHGLATGLAIPFGPSERGTNGHEPAPAVAE